MVLPCTTAHQPALPERVSHADRLAAELDAERDRYARGATLARNLVALAATSISPPPRVFLEHVLAPALDAHALLPDVAPPGPPSRREQADRAAAAAFRRIGERDGFRCRVCGADRTLTVDHVVAVINGGTDDDTNFQLLCRSHNSSKGSR